MNKAQLLILCLASWIIFPVLAVLMAYLGISWGSAFLVGACLISLALCIETTREYILDKLTI